LLLNFPKAEEVATWCIRVFCLRAWWITPLRVPYPT
jgi:hypothetical protein